MFFLSSSHPLPQKPVRKSQKKSLFYNGYIHQREKHEEERERGGYYEVLREREREREMNTELNSPLQRRTKKQIFVDLKIYTIKFINRTELSKCVVDVRVCCSYSPNENGNRKRFFLKLKTEKITPTFE